MGGIKRIKWLDSMFILLITAGNEETTRQRIPNEIQNLHFQGADGGAIFHSYSNRNKNIPIYITRFILFRNQDREKSAKNFPILPDSFEMKKSVNNILIPSTEDVFFLMKKINKSEIRLVNQG